MKRYIITDPCYLINDDAAWRRYCGLIFDEKGYMNADKKALTALRMTAVSVPMRGWYAFASLRRRLREHSAI